MKKLITTTLALMLSIGVWANGATPTVIAEWNYAAETASMPENNWPATSGLVTTGTNLEFFHAMLETRSNLGHATRNAVNVSNSNAGGWFRRTNQADTEPSEPITANASAGWVITLDTRGFENITFSASQATTGSGPRDFALAYRIGTTGVWTAFGGIVAIPNEGGTGAADALLSTFDEVALPAEMNNQAIVQLRVFIASNTNRGGTDLLANNGNTSINNIVFSGIGEPPVETPLVITNVGHYPIAPTQNDDIVVTATITYTTSLVESIVIEWFLNGAPQADIPMTAGANDIWTGSIPAQAADAEVEFRIFATNDLDEATWSGWSFVTIMDAGNISGTTGGLTWVVYDDVLTISVTADAPATAGMENFPHGGNAATVLTAAPWGVFADLFSEIVIEDRVTSIGNNAFRGLAYVTDLTLGADITTIGDTAFFGSGVAGALVLPDAVTSVGNSAFRATALTSVTTGAGMTTVEQSSFRDIATLTSVTIHPNVTTIGISAFRENPLLTSVEIPANVTRIELEAFRQSGLTSIVIPNSVTYLGDASFRQNPDLTSVTIGTGVTEIGEDVFRQTAVTVDVLPTRFTTVPEGMFRGTTAATVTIPNHIVTIEESAFREMPNLTSITLGTGLVTVGVSAFRENPLLTEVVIPNNVTTVLGDAFGQNPTLATVTIGSGVTNIADRAFGRNPALMTVISLSATPPTTHERAFRENLPADACLYVPTEDAVALYREATGWSVFTCIRVEGAEPSTLTISNVSHTPTTPEPGTPITVTATVEYTGSAIASVVIEWTRIAGGLPSPQPVMAMTPGENNVWTATIPGETAGTLVVFNILATNGLGDTEYTERDTITVAGGTNIAVIAENNAISVFPNPVVDVLTVTVADFAPGMTFNVFDVNGRLVHTGAISSSTTTVDMAHLRAGTYVLTIVQNGTQVATFRVVKQ